MKLKNSNLFQFGGIFLCFFLIYQINKCSALSESKSLADYDDDKTKSSEKSYKVVCYYTNWAQYRTKPATFFPENVNATLCTHVIFAFAKINELSELQSYEWNDESTDWSKGMYERVGMLKKDNKDLKVLVAVGGWNHGSLLFSNMARDDAKRKNFVTQTVKFLQKHKFDGLDIDWEYPANRDTEDRPDDKVHFTSLCKELHTAFKPHNFILTAAVAVGLKYMKTAYELGEIHKYLDIINIMAYDLHGGWDNVTGSNAPLYAHEFDIDKTLNVDFAVRYWLKYVPPEKLVLGVSSYGRSFQLLEGFESCPLTDTPVKGVGTAGKYTREPGSLSYFEVCEKILLEKWRYVWNDQQKVPFIYSNEIRTPSSQPIEWVGFEDVKSIEIKTKYIMKHKLGGGMIWALDFDDFTGNFCNQGKYPLLSVLNHYLRPSLNIPLPKSSLLWKSQSNPSGGSKETSILNTASKRPTHETDLMLNKFDSDSAAPHNIFGLIKNDVLQVYKFCQCKNGTHKINSNTNKNDDDKNTFVVNCNTKKVYLATNPPSEQHEHDEDIALINKSNQETNVIVKGENEEKKKKPKKEEDDFENIWSIFGIKSKASVFEEKIDDKNKTLSSEPKLVCYLSYFFNKRAGYANLKLANIDAQAVNSCNVLVYSFVKINNKTFDTIMPLQDTDYETLESLKSLKLLNPDLKILISLGSHMHSLVSFSKMMQISRLRRNFVRNTIMFLNKYKLDGIEVNWNQKTSLITENKLELNKNKLYFTKFLEELSQALKPFNLITSALLSGLNNVADNSYEIEKIHKYLDFATLFLYDFYEIPLKLTSADHHSPLYNTYNSDIQTQDLAVQFYTVKGFPKEKLLLGLNSYGRSYLLFKNIEINSKKGIIGRNVNRQGSIGDFTKTTGVLAFYEVCENIYQNPEKWKISQLPNQPIPYLYSSNEEEFICFDDIDSIIFKTNYAKTKKLGGVSLFSLDFDDFSGKFCMSGKFPLLRAAKEALREFKNEDDESTNTTSQEDSFNNIETVLASFY